jgi:hypothetical protein
MVDFITALILNLLGIKASGNCLRQVALTGGILPSQ